MRDHYRACGAVQSGEPWFDKLVATCVEEWERHPEYTRVAFVQSGHAWTEYEVLRELIKVRAPTQVHLSECHADLRASGVEVMCDQLFVEHPSKDVRVTTSSVHVPPHLTHCLFVAINPNTTALTASEVGPLPTPSTYVSVGLKEGKMTLEVAHSPSRQRVREHALHAEDVHELQVRLVARDRKGHERDRRAHERSGLPRRGGVDEHTEGDVARHVEGDVAAQVAQQAVDDAEPRDGTHAPRVAPTSATTSSAST